MVKVILAWLCILCICFYGNYAKVLESEDVIVDLLKEILEKKTDTGRLDNSEKVSEHW